MKRSILYAIIGVLLVMVIVLAALQFTGGGNQSATPAANVEGLGDAAAALVADRGLTSENVYAALKTYMPSGQHDPYMMFASGGHSGQIHVIGIPSMRILRTIAVFAPEPWQGYGYGEATQQSAMFDEGDVLGANGVRWGDTHHPGTSVKPMASMMVNLSSSTTRHKPVSPLLICAILKQNSLSKTQLP